MKNIDISIVVPVYREEEIIEDFYAELNEDKNAFSYELVLKKRPKGLGINP